MFGSRDLADRIIGAPRLELADRSWPLAITYGVLLLSEGELGEDVLTGRHILQPSAKFLRVLLWACLKRCGSNWSPADVGRQITPRRLPEIRALLISAWLASFPKREAVEQDRDEDEGESQAEQKPLDWLGSWAFARWDLKLGEAEWLEMTPRQLYALRLRRIEQFQREELLVGIVSATVANYSERGPKRPMDPESFMIHKLPKKPRRGGTLADAFKKYKAKTKG